MPINWLATALYACIALQWWCLIVLWRNHLVYGEHGANARLIELTANTIEIKIDRIRDTDAVFAFNVAACWNVYDRHRLTDSYVFCPWKSIDAAEQRATKAIEGMF